jgi:hypothetical protein
MDEWIKIGLSVISIILVPGVGYYLKSEIQLNSSAIKEWTNHELSEVYEMIKREVAHLEARISNMEIEQTTIKNSREIVDLKMQHIDEKISGIDKKTEVILNKMETQNEMIIKFLASKKNDSNKDS